MYDSREDLFVPAMADASEYSFQMPPVSLTRNSTENFFTNRQMAAGAASSFSTEINQNTADITLESLLEQPGSCRNLVASALDGNRDGLLNGLQAMKARINSLENQQNETKRNFFDLQLATDTYTKLLQLKPIAKFSVPNRTDVERGDLLDDTNIRTIYDLVQLRVKNLEARKRLTNSNSDPEFQKSNNVIHQLSNASLSDVEKTRGAAGSDAKFFAEMRNLDTIPVPDVGLDGLFQTNLQRKVNSYKFQPISEATSTGSSRSLNLTEKQRTKLNSFKEKLRTSVIFPAASSSPIRDRESHFANKSIQCDVCRLDKTTQCVCYSNADRTEKWAQTSFPRKENGELNPDVEQNGRANYEELRRRLLLLRQEAKMQHLLKHENVYNEIVKRPSSAPASPIRKIQKQELFIDDKKPTFVAGKSNVNSHSVGVNLQELLAILKRQNPALHQICLKMGGRVSLTTMAEAFEMELKNLKSKAQKCLKEKIKIYDQLSAEIKSCKDFDARKNELVTRRNAMVSDIEKTDTYIQRLDDQSTSLVRLTKKAQSLISVKNGHDCKSLDPRPINAGTPNDAAMGLSKPTVSSRQKTSALKNHSKHFNHKRSVQVLKDIKLAKDVLNAI